MRPELDIRYTDVREEAHRWMLEGYEPIECAFGDKAPVMGPLCMDHHGTESWREGVALRACRDHYGARQDDPRFVVTGTPDADAVLAIIGLAALLPHENIPPTFFQLVNQHDLDPINIELLEETGGIELLLFQQTECLRRDSASFYRAIRVMCDILQNELPRSQRDNIIQREKRRIQLAENCHLEPIGAHVLLVESRVWGFDRWYRRAPAVVSFSRRFHSVTVGCRDLATAKEILGPKGLLAVFPQLGHGWGGRESIGGSPRGKQLSLEEAREAAHTIEASIQYYQQHGTHKDERNT